MVQAAASWLVLLAISIGISTLFGAPLHDAMLYAAYMALFVMMPGALLLSLASRRPNGPIEFAIKAVVIGQCFEMASGLLFTMLGIQAAYQMLPCVFLIGVILNRHRIARCISQSQLQLSKTLVACVLAAVFLVFAASLSDFSNIIDHHYTWVAAFSNAVSISWPPIEPFIMDVPLHYHYLYNVHVGMAAHITGVPLILVASRLAIIVHGLTLIGMLYVFAQSRMAAAWLGIVVATALLLTFGYSELMWKSFHFATAQIMFRVASTMIAFQIFIVLLDEVLAERQERIRYWLLVGLVLVGCGTRVNMLPMLASGVGCLMLAKFAARERFKDYAILLATLAGGVVFSIVFFLGFGSTVSDGTKLVVFNPLNIPVAEWAELRYAPIIENMLANGAPSWLASLVYVVTAVCGRMTFLLPGLLYVLMKPVVTRDMLVMLGGVALAGIGLLVCIETTVPQEVWGFYWYADIALGVLGTAGLYAMWMSRRQGGIWVNAGLVATGILLVVQVAEFSTGFIPKLSASDLPMSMPAFHDQKNDAVARTLIHTIKPGDVLVTGGAISEFDDRPFAAAVPGIQLYGSRYILDVYATRTIIDPKVASRLWLIKNDLSKPADRSKVKRDVGNTRNVYMLWLGTGSFNTSGMTRIEAWDDRSLWRIEE